jgi:hypothetical protein
LGPKRKSKALTATQHCPRVQPQAAR